MPVTPRLAVVTVVGSLAYLGLAVLGWGGFAAFFAHPARIALDIAVFMLTGVALFSGVNLSRGEREDRGNRSVIIAPALIGLMSAYLPAYTERKGFWIVDGDAIRWLGVVLFAVGGALRLWPVFVLGRRFSGRSRHPAGTHAGHQRCVWGHPSPQLSRIARQRSGMGSRFSFGSLVISPAAGRRA